MRRSEKQSCIVFFQLFVFVSLYVCVTDLRTYSRLSSDGGWLMRQWHFLLSTLQCGSAHPPHTSIVVSLTVVSIVRLRVATSSISHATSNSTNLTNYFYDIIGLALVAYCGRVGYIDRFLYGILVIGMVYVEQI